MSFNKFLSALNADIARSNRLVIKHIKDENNNTLKQYYANNSLIAETGFTYKLNDPRKYRFTRTYLEDGSVCVYCGSYKSQAQALAYKLSNYSSVKQALQYIYAGG